MLHTYTVTYNQLWRMLTGLSLRIFKYIFSLYLELSLSIYNTLIDNFTYSYNKHYKAIF